MHSKDIIQHKIMSQCCLQTNFTSSRLSLNIWLRRVTLRQWRWEERLNTTRRIPRPSAELTAEAEARATLLIETEPRRLNPTTRGPTSFHLARVASQKRRLPQGSEAIKMVTFSLCARIFAKCHFVRHHFGLAWRMIERLQCAAQKVGMSLQGTNAGFICEHTCAVTLRSRSLFTQRQGENVLFCGNPLFDRQNSHGKSN